MENDRLILNLDLSYYFEDLRKYSKVLVDFSKFQVVGDVEEHIKHVFSIQDNICLVNDDFLIPKYEDILILKHCSLLKVVKCDFFDKETSKEHKSNKIKINADQSCSSNNTYSEGLNGNCSFSETSTANSLKSKSKKRKYEGQEFQNEDENYERKDSLGAKKVNIRMKNCEGKVCIKSYIEHSFQNEGIQHPHDKNSLKDSSKPNQEKNNKIPGNSCYGLDLSYRKNEEFLHNQEMLTLDESKSVCDVHLIEKHRKHGGLKCKEVLSNHFYPREKEEKIGRDVQNVLGNSNVVMKIETNNTKNINELKKQSLEQINSLLLAKIDTVPMSYNATAESTNPEHSDIWDSTQNSEDKSEIDQHSEQPNGKRRKRKHAKKKKREAQYLSAVGPILDTIMETQVQSSRPLSTNAKHIFFEEELPEDVSLVTKETNNTTLDYRHLETLHLSSFQNDSIQIEESELNTPQPVNMQVEEANNSSWQQELLKLTSLSKPKVYHRNKNTSTPKRNGDSTGDLNISNSKSHNVNEICMESERVERKLTNGGISCTNSNENEEQLEVKHDIEGITKSDLHKEKTELVIEKHNLTDVDSIDPNNYPIINAVKNGDVILFKILKLSENYEPVASKPILARVVNAAKFPECIQFDIIGGSDYSMESGDGPTAEFRFTDLIEPRLCYP